MKKNLKKISIALVAAVCGLLCVLCAACAPSGTYKFSSFTFSVLATTTEVKAGEEYLGTTVDADSITITLNSDGTGSSNILGATADFTYEAVEGEKNVYKTSTGIEMTVSGSSLVFEYSILGITANITLKK